MGRRAFEWNGKEKKLDQFEIEAKTSGGADSNKVLRCRKVIKQLEG